MRERTEGDWMHGEWTRKLHKISIYSPTNAHYYMTDIRLNCKFIISHNSIYILYAVCNVHSTWNDIKNIPSHLLLFSQPIQKWASETHTSHELYCLWCHTPDTVGCHSFLFLRKPQICVHNTIKKIRAKWKISSSSHSLCDYCKPINLLVMFWEIAVPAFPLLSSPSPLSLHLQITTQAKIFLHTSMCNADMIK